MDAAQITALRAKCFADPSALAFFVPDGAAGLQAYLNAASGTNVWRTDAKVNDIIDAITWASYTPNDAVASGDSGDTLHRKNGWLLTIQTKQMNLQLMLQGRETINCAPPNVRVGLRDCVIQVPSGAGGAVTSPGGANGATVLARCVRSANRAELMLAADAQGSDTTGGVNARVATFEGTVTPLDAATLIFKDDGSIWAP